MVYSGIQRPREWWEKGLDRTAVSRQVLKSCPPTCFFLGPSSLPQFKTPCRQFQHSTFARVKLSPVMQNSILGIMSPCSWASPFLSAAGYQDSVLIASLATTWYLNLDSLLPRNSRSLHCSGSVQTWQRGVDAPVSVSLLKPQTVWLGDTDGGVGRTP